jgi:hypothetical protein
VGVFFLNAYKVENVTDNPFGLLEAKWDAKLRSTITVPFLMLAWNYTHRELCGKEVLYETVTGCRSYVAWQFWVAIGVAAAAWAVDLLPAYTKREGYLKGLAAMGPLVVFLVVFGLECQSIQLMLLCLYALALCFAVIR